MSEAIASRWRAGEPISELAVDYRSTPGDIEVALRHELVCVPRWRWKQRRLERRTLT